MIDIFEDYTVEELADSLYDVTTALMDCVGTPDNSPALQRFIERYGVLP